MSSFAASLPAALAADILNFVFVAVILAIVSPAQLADALKGIWHIDWQLFAFGLLGADPWACSTWTTGP